MSIAWMTHFTPTVDPEALRRSNERRAATVYALWRAGHRRAETLMLRLRERRCATRLDRDLRRELGGLPDHVLGDLGLWRGGDGRLGHEPRRAAGTAALPWPTSHGLGPVVDVGTIVTAPVTAPTVSRMPDRAHVDERRNRAA